ncbi:MAG: aminotransferase class IV [Verrucomicrobiota bacterium]
MTSLHVHLNGETIPAAEATISVSDRALAYGQGVFETIGCYEGRPFAEGAHYDRLEAGAAALGIAMPDRGALARESRDLLKKNGLRNKPQARIRITLTGGSPNQSSTVLIEATEPPDHPPTARCIRVPFTRNDRGALSGYKTINYGENVIAHRLALAAKANEAIFGNTRGFLCEGTWSNIFILIDDSLVTPPLSSGCLPGIMRAEVIELSREIGINTIEEDFPLSEIASVDGAFLTSCIREIQPITHVDDIEIPESPIVDQLHGALQERIRQFLRYLG